MPRGVFVNGWWYPMSKVRKNARGEWELKPERAVVVVKDVAPIDEAASATAPTVDTSAGTAPGPLVSATYQTKVVNARRRGDADSDKAAADSHD